MERKEKRGEEKWKNRREIERNRRGKGWKIT
jgi:hypothetical protein